MKWNKITFGGLSCVWNRLFVFTITGKTCCGVPFWLSNFWFSFWGVLWLFSRVLDIHLVLLVVRPRQTSLRHIAMPFRPSRNHALLPTGLCLPSWAPAVGIGDSHAPRPEAAQNLSLCTVAPQNLNRRIRHSTLRGCWCGGGCVSQEALVSLLLHTSPPLLCLDRSGATTLRKLNAGLCTSSPHSPTSIHTVAYWFRYISTSENGCPLFTSFLVTPCLICHYVDLESSWCCFCVPVDFSFPASLPSQCL